jgi:hypothetical protein
MGIGSSIFFLDTKKILKNYIFLLTKSSRFEMNLNLRREKTVNYVMFLQFQMIFLETTDQTKQLFTRLCVLSYLAGKIDTFSTKLFF